MIILDTNVLSALMRNAPDQTIASWMDRQPQSSVWTNSITILEIQTGLHVMPSGRKRVSLSEDFERLLDRIDHRIVRQRNSLPSGWHDVQSGLDFKDRD